MTDRPPSCPGIERCGACAWRLAFSPEVPEPPAGGCALPLLMACNGPALAARSRVALFVVPPGFFDPPPR